MCVFASVFVFLYMYVFVGPFLCKYAFVFDVCVCSSDFCVFFLLMYVYEKSGYMCICIYAFTYICVFLYTRGCLYVYMYVFRETCVVNVCVCV